MFHNLLVKDGEIWYCSDRKERLELIPLSVGFLQHIRTKQTENRWCPRERSTYHDTVDAELTEIHFFCDNDVAGHIGHVVFDSIASQFATLRLTGIPLSKDTTIRTLQRYKGGERHADIKSAYSLIFGEPITYSDKFFERYEGQVVVINTLVTGCSKKGIGYYGTDYCAHNGYVGAWKEFRDYCYLRAGVGGNRDCNVLYATTVNGRTDRVIVNDDQVCEVIKTHPNGKIVDWTKMPTLKEQIETMFHTNIYISVDGSSGLNALFLPSNAIFISLGAILPNHRSVPEIHGHVNDCVYPACDMRTVYYHDHVKYNKQHGYGIDLEKLAYMIVDPKKYLSTRNYSEYGKNFLKYLLSLSPESRKVVVFNALLNAAPFACTMFNYGLIPRRIAHRARDPDTCNPLDSCTYLYLYNMYMNDAPCYYGEKLCMTVEASISP